MLRKPARRSKNTMAFWKAFCLCNRDAVLLDELVIVNPAGADEKDRWKDVHAMQYTYRESN